MWQEIFEQSMIVISVIFCAIAVKLADDFLDYDLDTRTGSRNFTSHFGNGTVIYAMLSLALAASINALVSIPLFLASYSIGMFGDLKQPFPSGLTGWQESLLVLFFGVLLWGWQQLLFSLFFIGGVQLFDDYLDAQAELIDGRNIANQIGKVECLLLSSITMLTAWHIEEHMFFSVFLGFFLFYSLLFFYQKRGYEC